LAIPGFVFVPKFNEFEKIFTRRILFFIPFLLTVSGYHMHNCKYIQKVKLSYIPVSAHFSD